MKRFLAWVFLDYNMPWGFWKPVIACVLVAVPLAFGIVGVAHALNSEKIAACEVLGGTATPRGFNCELPTGEIVSPVKYLEAE